MKKVLVVLTLASFFAACNGKPKETAILVDTAAIQQKAVLQEQARSKAEADRIKAETEARIKAEADERSRIAAANRTTRHHSSGSSSTPVSTGSVNSTEVPARRGMSSAAKGTIIGGVAGAAAGGIIGHDLKGAAIGGAVGAGAGYIIGRGKDRKSGRVVKQ